MDRLLPLAIVFALLAACGKTGFPPSRPHDVRALEPPVKRLVDRRIAAVEAAPADARAHAMLGAAYQGNGLWLAAAESFAQAAALDPADRLWPYYGARAMNQLGRWGEARALLDASLAIDPDFAAALLMRGWMQLEDGDEADARASFQAASRVQPGAEEPIIGLATLALEDGDAEGALRLIDGAVKAGRLSRHARFVRGRALVQLGRIDEGRREMEAGADAGGKAMETTFTKEILNSRVNRTDVLSRAVDLRRSGRPEQALRELDELRRDYPNDPLIESNRAGVLSDLGRTDEAIAGMEAALRLDGSLARTWTNLSLLYLRAGRLEDALEAAERATALDALDHTAWATISEVRRRRQDLMGSFEAIRRAIDLDPTSGDYEAKLGNLYATVGQDEPALACFERAAERMPDVAQVRLAIASTALRMSRFDRARTALEEARRIDPNVQGLAALERRLMERGGR